MLLKIFWRTISTKKREFWNTSWFLATVLLALEGEKIILETSGEDVKITLETGGEDVKITLETSGEDFKIILETGWEDVKITLETSGEDQLGDDPEDFLRWDFPNQHLC